MSTATPTTEPRVGRARGRRTHYVTGVHPDALPPDGAVELPDEDEQELAFDDVATAPNPTDEKQSESASTGRKLITGGDPDAPARIPLEVQFGEESFLADSQLDRVVSALQDKRGLPTRDVVLHIRFKAKGGTRSGKPNTGGCVKLAGPAKHFGKADYLIWIAADHAREMHYTAWQLEAELYHQLLHMQVEENEEGDINRSVRGHDLECFFLEFQIYGTWRPDLKRMQDVVQARQVPLDL